MTNEDTKQLCLDLLRVDSENDAIDLLGLYGLWNPPSYWRYFGDKEDNYAAIGNQQSRPEAALVEKIVNSVDARLMNECQIRGITPSSPDAPQTIPIAVSKFFVSEQSPSETSGSILNWDDKQRQRVAEGITLAATGEKSNPCFTIADIGEGQTPDKMPDTLLSLDKQNKRRIQFVQGTFNMGGTGVLRFCGHHNLQLIISRRNPQIVSTMKETDDDSAEYWGFTIVRRENPSSQEKTSTYTYLAPMGSDTNPRKGRILRFLASELPLMPNKNRAYERHTQWGTVIKIYEYGLRKGTRSHILQRDGLLHALDLLLPEIALPVRLHECREYGGDEERSFVTNMNGLVVRLEDGRHDNLEEGFPEAVQFQLESGEQFSARIYAFRKGRSKTYRRNEGIIFTLNGQTQGQIPKTFFDRTKVKMGRLADSILIVVDCSNIPGRSREDLFINSRDRLSGGELRSRLEEELEDLVSKHDGLRRLRERRKREETEESLADSKPLEEILKSILRASPTLSALFLTGQRLSNPFKVTETDTEEKLYEGKKHPTFFKFRKLEYGVILDRTCPRNQRCRISYETDVVNDYFKRSVYPGQFSLSAYDQNSETVNVSSNIHLHDGRATLNVKFPEDICVGTAVRIHTRVEDPTLLLPFENNAQVLIEEEQETESGGTGRRKPPSDRKGTAAEKPSGIELPRPSLVRRVDWETHEFDEYSACRIVQDESDDEPDRLVYSYYINVDNFYLKTEEKLSRADPAVLQTRFVYGMVLVAVALIREHIEKHKKTLNGEDNSDPDEGENLPQRVSHVTKALAPFILPLIECLGGLSQESIAVSSEIGDDE